MVFTLLIYSVFKLVEMLQTGKCNAPIANVTVEKKKELFHRSCQLARVLMSSAIITTIYNTTINTTIKLT